MQMFSILNILICGVSGIWADLSGYRYFPWKLVTIP
jgi:hypothetical protein